MTAADVLSSLNGGSSSTHRHESAPSSAGLMLELVALRDIRAGDEVFIDYGKAYEDAWTEHKLTLRSRMDKWDDYAYTNQLNHILRTIRTIDEQVIEPYPSNVLTSCLYVYSNTTISRRHQQGDDMMATTSTEEQGELQADGTITTRAVWQSHPQVFQPTFLRPCRILERTRVSVSPPTATEAVGGDTDDTINNAKSDFLYTVEMLNRQFHPKQRSEAEEIPLGERHIVMGVPREAIYFSNKPYTTDQHLQYAFRHEMGLPEGTFPPAWMDII
jgi:hypothetical protein